jgi:hypothetical protein
MIFTASVAGPTTGDQVGDRLPVDKIGRHLRMEVRNA